MGLVLHVACVREMRNAGSILVGKPEGNSSVRRSRCRYV
jgi:hypothetical protein